MRQQRIESAVFLAIMLMLALVAAGYVNGCATLQGVFKGPTPTPKTRVAQLETDYTAVMRVLVDARLLGKISDAEYVAIEQHRKQAAAALDVLKLSVASGTLDSTALEQFRTALDALIAAKAKVTQ